MSRGKKVAIVVGVLLVLLGGVGLALPTIAARGLESKLSSSLKGRAQDARWGSLEVDWSGALDVRDLEFEDPERGIAFVAERVFIKPTLQSLFDGEPHIKEVRLVGARLSVDAGVLKAKMDASKEEEGGDKKEAAEEKPTTTLAKLKHTLRNDPPSVSFEDVEFRLDWGSKSLFEFSTREGTLEREGEEVVLSARGDAAIVWEKIPRLMRQARPWGVDARVGLHEKTARVSLTLGNKAAALLDLVLPRVGYLKMGALDLDVSLTDEARHARVDVSDLDTKLGDVDELIASIKAEHLSTDLLAERRHVRASGVALEVTPQKLTEIQNLGKRLKPSAILKKRIARASEPVSWRSALARVEQYAHN